MELTIQNLTKEFGTLRAVDSVSVTMTGGVYVLLFKRLILITLFCV